MFNIRNRHNHPIHVVHHRRYRRLKRLAILALLITAAGAFWLWRDLNRLEADSPKAIGTTTQVTIAGPETYRSAYFEFKDTAKWYYSPKESTATKLVYKMNVGGLPGHALTVYVNQTPLQNDLAVTHALPAQVKDGNVIVPGDLSDHCGKLYQPNELKRIRPVSINGTSVLCVPDSPQYVAVVGQAGGDYNLKLRRTTGETANYIIIYRNLMIEPDPGVFTRIMKTFRAL